MAMRGNLRRHPAPVASALRAEFGAQRQPYRTCPRLPRPLESAMPEFPGEARPTRTRFWVVVFAVTLAIIQYIDRVCISQAAKPISEDLHLSESQMGWVFSAFTLAYALFEIPGGYLGDRIGPRKVLLR